ncbi:MAG TPA: hypothetical protein PLS69_05820 [Terricaulis sp.]|nr:hypothetical protein [Terricaulis sp.]HRP11045.1 hypothetical protein [Terricaulis sp.]
MELAQCAACYACSEVIMPEQQKKTAKSGHKPGEGANPPQKGGKRPVKEEDAFGGAERTHNTDVKSKNAKP